MEVAWALKYLRDQPDFHSNDEVGALFGVRGEIVRAFISLTTLPEHVQQMLERKELRLDQGTKLAGMMRRAPAHFNEVAGALAHVPSQDARDIIDFVIRNPSTPVPEAMRLVRLSKVMVEDEFHVVVVLSKDEFSRLDAEAQRRTTDPSSLARNLLIESLSRAE